MWNQPYFQFSDAQQQIYKIFLQTPTHFLISEVLWGKVQKKQNFYCFSYIQEKKNIWSLMEKCPLEIKSNETNLTDD